MPWYVFGLEQAVSILICTLSPLLWLRYSSHLTLCTGSEVVHSTVAERFSNGPRVSGKVKTGRGLGYRRWAHKTLRM